MAASFAAVPAQIVARADLEVNFAKSAADRSRCG
jgi:hypothetical protein